SSVSSGGLSDAGRVGSGLSPASAITPETHSMVSMSHERSGSRPPVTGSRQRMSRIRRTTASSCARVSSDSGFMRVPLVVVGHQYGRTGTIGLGDDPGSAVAPAVGREQPEALPQGQLLLGGVVRADVAPG